MNIINNSFYDYDEDDEIDDETLIYFNTIVPEFSDNNYVKKRMNNMEQNMTKLFFINLFLFAMINNVNNNKYVYLY